MAEQPLKAGCSGEMPRIKRALTWLTVAGLLLAACVRSPAPSIEATQVVATVTQAPRRPGAATSTTTVTDRPTLHPSATPTLTPIPAPLLSLEEAAYLGRGQIVDAAFLPDGSAVAIGWASGVSLWSLADGTERWWRPTGAPAIALDIDPAGEAVAAALADGSIWVLNADDGRGVRDKGARSHAYWGDLAWSPDGRQIAYQFIGPNRGDPIYLLDAGSGSLGEVPGSRIDSGTLPYLVWSPDSRSITLPSLGEACSRIVDAQTGETTFTLGAQGSCYAPYYVAWSPNGNTVAVADRIVDLATGQTVVELQGGSAGFPFLQSGHTIAFSPDGTTVAAGGQLVAPNRLAPIVVWDTGTGTKVAQIGVEVDSYDPERYPARVAFAFDDASLLVLYEDGEIARWTLGGEPPEKAVLGRTPAFPARLPWTWSVDGRRIAAGSRYGGAVVWDVATSRQVAAFEAPLGAPVLSANGRLLALTDQAGGQLLIVDLEAGELEPAAVLPGAAAMPQGAVFSPDGALIAYGSGSQVVLADAVTGEQVADLTGHPESQLISRVIWSPGGDALVTASGEPGNDTALGPLILWQRTAQGTFAEAFRTATTRSGYDCCVPLALFNPAGNLVALEELPNSEAGHFAAIVYDLEAHQVIRTLREHVLAAWVSDEVLLTSEAQYWIRLTRWDVHTGESAVLSGRGEGDNAYAPDAAFYARPYLQRPYAMRGIEVYDSMSGIVVEGAIYDGDVLRIAWSADGGHIGALASNGMVVVWPVHRDAPQ